jgi:hypothetical protein
MPRRLSWLRLQDSCWTITAIMRLCRELTHLRHLRQLRILTLRGPHCTRRHSLCDRGLRHRPQPRRRHGGHGHGDLSRTCHVGDTHSSLAGVSRVLLDMWLVLQL